MQLEWEAHVAKSIPEGSVFLFPIKGRAPGLAVVARRVPRARIVALYLFSEAPPEALSGGEFDLPRPDQATFRGRFSDYQLREGAWRALGIHPRFKRDEWPFNMIAHWPFGHSGEAIGLVMDDRNPVVVIDSFPISDELALTLPADALFAPEGMEEFVPPD